MWKCQRKSRFWRANAYVRVTFFFTIAHTLNHTENAMRLFECRLFLSLCTTYGRTVRVFDIAQHFFGWTHARVYCFSIVDIFFHWLLRSWQSRSCIRITKIDNLMVSFYTLLFLRRSIAKRKKLRTEKWCRTEWEQTSECVYSSPPKTFCQLCDTSHRIASSIEFISEFMCGTISKIYVFQSSKCPIAQKYRSKFNYLAK